MINHIFKFKEKDNFAEPINNAKLIISKINNNEPLLVSDLVGVFDVGYYCHEGEETLYASKITYDEKQLSKGNVEKFIVFDFYGGSYKDRAASVAIKESDFYTPTQKDLDSIYSAELAKDDESLPLNYSDIRNVLGIDTTTFESTTSIKPFKYAATNNSCKIIFLFEYLNSVQPFFYGPVKCEFRTLEEHSIDRRSLNPELGERREEFMLSTSRINNSRIENPRASSGAHNFQLFSTYIGSEQFKNRKSLHLLIADENFTEYTFKNLIATILRNKDKMFYISYYFTDPSDKRYFVIPPYLCVLNAFCNNVAFYSCAGSSVSDFLNNKPIRKMLVNNRDIPFRDQIPIMSFGRDQDGDFLSINHLNSYEASDKIASCLMDELDKAAVFEGGDNQKYSWTQIKTNIAFSSDAKVDTSLDYLSVCKRVVIQHIIDFIRLSPQRKGFRKDVVNHLIEQLQSMKLLTAMVFSVELAHGDDDEWDVNEASNERLYNKLKQLAFDAQAHSDGIIEIIENAINHSKSHGGCLWFRTWNTSHDRNEDNEIKRIIRRKELNSKYYSERGDDSKVEGKKVDGKVERYIEVEIFDFYTPVSTDAKSLNIKSYFEDLHPEVGDINFAGFFDPKRATDKHLAYLRKKESRAHHYGLRMFAKAIKNNGGVFSVQSFSSKYNPYFDWYGSNNRIEFRWIVNKTGDLLFIVPSRDGDESSYRYSSNNSKINNKYGLVYYGTTYSILLPLNYLRPDIEVEKSDKIYDISRIDQSITCIQLPMDETNRLFVEWGRNLKTQNAKIELAQQIGAVLKKTVESAIEFQTGQNSQLNPTNIIISMDIARPVAENMEIFCKSLIEFFCDRDSAIKSGKQFPVYYAINWTNDSPELFIEESIRDFIRTFSIVYLPNDDENESANEPLKNIQIALTTKNKVCFMLAGENINSLYATAKNFAYYNFDNSAPYLNALQSIIDDSAIQDIDQNNAIPSIFPFDIYLETQVSKENQLKQPWFVKDLLKILGTSRLSGAYGARLDNAVFKIGQQIRSETFYETDLVLNNIANIYKIAYMIVRDLLMKYKANSVDINQIFSSNRFVVVGYRQYTNILVRCIESVLRDYVKQINLPNNVFSGMVLFDTECNEYFEKPLECTYSELQNSQYIFVMPISITLSAFSAMKRIICNDIGIDVTKLNVAQNVCVFVSTQIGNEEKYKISFADSNKPYNSITDLTKKFEVSFIAHAENTYKYSYEEKVLSPNPAVSEKLLVGTNKANSKPDRIFELFNRKPAGQILKLKAPDYQQIEALHGCIDYAHLERNENHYLFYTNTAKYFHRLLNEQSKALENWVNGVKECISKNTMDGDNNHFVFNILVAPQHESNSEFIKYIVDKAFKHNIKFIYFLTDQSYREDIKSRYSYVISDIQEINKTFSNATINVYFIDDTIVSGKSFIRTKNLMEMLVREALDFDEDNIRVNIFAGIILLINRCSENRILQYLECANQKSVENRFFPYLSLKFPSLKTSGFKCPSCKLVDRYKQMSKEATTLQLSDEWDRLSKKHSVVSYLRYNAELRKQIKNPKRHNYLDWYKQWLYSNCILSQDKNSPYNISILSELAKRNEKDDQLADVIIDGPIAERNYIRLKTLEASVEKLDGIFADGGVSPESKNLNNAVMMEEILFETRIRIMSLLAEGGFTPQMEKLVKKNKKSSIYNNKELTALIMSQTEWLISCIKVISRPVMSTYYHIGQAILTVMLELIESFIDGKPVLYLDYQDYDWAKNRRANDIKEYQKQFLSILNVVRARKVNENDDKEREYFVPPLTQYQFVYTLMKRLSDLGSVYMLNPANKKKLLNVWEEMRTRLDELRRIDNQSLKEYFEYNVIDLEKSAIITDYTRLAKWALFSRGENSVSYEFNESLLKNDPELSDKLNQCLYLENTHVLYEHILARINNTNYHTDDDSEFSRLIGLDFTNIKPQSSSVNNEKRDVFVEHIKDGLINLAELVRAQIKVAQDSERAKDFVNTFAKMLKGASPDIISAHMFVKSRNDELTASHLSSVQLLSSCPILSKQNYPNDVINESYFSSLLYDIDFKIDDQKDGDKKVINADCRWVMDTFCIIPPKDIALIKIPFIGANDIKDFAYIALRFNENIAIYNIMFALRNILFIRHDIEAAFSHYGGLIKKDISERSIEEIVKEVFRCITQAGGNHYALVSVCNKYQQLCAVLDYAETLFNELKTKDAWFSTEISDLTFIKNPHQVGIQLGGNLFIAKSTDNEEKVKDIARKISKLMTPLMSGYYLSVEKLYDELSERFARRIKDSLSDVIQYSPKKESTSYGNGQEYVYFPKEYWDEIDSCISDINAYSDRNALLLEVSIGCINEEVVICIKNQYEKEKEADLYEKEIKNRKSKSHLKFLRSMWRSGDSKNPEFLIDKEKCIFECRLYATFPQKLRIK